ncbi:MAG: hypothetical protein JO266_17335 [Acidobacteria bacterium]|nr:hypothetical protein [Acidobacteriota bacterium]
MTLIAADFGKSGRSTLMSVASMLALAILAPVLVAALRADSIPAVKLNADQIAPRAIEELTGRNVTRDYAYAWRDLAAASESARADLLNDYFTGFAKDKLVRRIADQQKTGVRIRYIDHGHNVRALFYAPDGGEMQLVDNAQLEIEIRDGSKIIYREKVKRQYLVLMTPGADRWFVRSLDQMADHP